MRAWILGLWCLTGWALPGHGQEVWSLERCVQTALANNLNIELADLNVESAILETRRYTWARLPSLNASLSTGYQFGRTIDPTTNDFIEANTQFGNGQLQAGWLLFNGFRISNSLRQAKVNVDAGKATAEDTRNNMALMVASAYLNVLFAEEQYQTARRQVDLSQEQLAQSGKLVQAGLRPENERLAMSAQLAQSEFQATGSRNSLDQAFLSLKQLLRLDGATEMQLERPEIRVDRVLEQDVLTEESVYRVALQTQPVIRAADLKAESAEKGVDIAKAAYYPSLTVFGGLSSAYSNNFLNYAQPDYSNATATLGQAIPVVIDGQEATLAQYSLSGITFPTVSFSDQLERNFGKNVGLSMSVPIYNNHTARIGVQRSRIAEQQARIQAEQSRQTLRTNVEQAVQAARAARLQYASAVDALTSQRAAYEAMKKRYDVGAANAVEFTQARTALDNAESQLVIGKYELVFRMKVLDFYLGKPLTLD